LVLRARVDLRAPVERLAVVRLAVPRLAAGFFAADERVAAEPAVLARDAAGFFAVDRLAVERLAVDRFAAGLARVLEALAAPPRDADADPALPLLLSDHLPDITRCAASATASAISEPNLVALATMLLAALDAVSAASRPASRIARRALGLALIAAAAAASPAASISLLIAALASLSTLLPFELEDDLDELLRVDLAITSSPSSRTKSLEDRNGSRTNPHAESNSRSSGHVKGHRCNAAMPFDMVSDRALEPGRPGQAG
jgi:hypothetical protein